MKQKEVIAITAIILFAFAGLVLRNFPFSQANLDKAMPPVITSYDVFANTEQIKWIYDSEQAYYYSPPRTGGISNVLATFTSPHYTFIATFTKLTTLPIYQTAYLMVNILSIIIILQIFVIVRKLFGDTPALIGLALASIPEHHWLFPMYIGFQYDYFTFITLPALIFFIILRLETILAPHQKTLLYTLFGFFFAEQFLGHYVELFFYALVFIVLPLIFVFWNRIISFKEYLTAIVIITIIMTPFIISFLPLTLKDHLRGGIKSIQGQVNVGEGSKHVEYFPWPRFDFWLNILSFIGIITIAINIRKNMTPTRSTYLLFIIYLLFVGFSNYIFGVSASRAERQIFQGYPFLVLFPAIGITTLLKTTLTIIKQQKLTALATIVIIIFISFSTWGDTYGVLRSIDQAAFVDDAKWASITWIRDNTPKDARAFFLSGFEHEFSMFSERINLKGDLNREYTIENIKSLCNGEYPDKYLGEWAFREYSHYGDDHYVRKRKGINTFTDVVHPFQNESEVYVFKGPGRGNQSVPLTFFDYVVLQYKGTGFDPCMTYFINESINRGHTLAWTNNEMAIVKINRSVKG